MEVYTQRGDDHCGPAALAAVYRFWQADETEAGVAARILNQAEGGTLPLMLVADARRQGFQAAFSQTETARLVEALQSGVPAICLVESARTKHFVVVQGYRLRGGAVELRVGEGRGRSRWIGASRWETTWHGGGNFAVFVWPSGHAFTPPPRDSVEVPYRPYSAAEHNDFGVVYEAEGDLRRAEIEFRRAVEKDPSHAVAWTNFVNVLNAGGRREEARAAYRQALALEPGNGPAANNLALTYRDQPRLGLAILDLHQPLVDPAFLPTLESTRKALSDLQQTTPPPEF
jgi:tetratricopeptide (TPR) repeat protein